MKQEQVNLDLQQAATGLEAFCAVTDLPATIEDFSGQTLVSCGAGCADCQIKPLYESMKEKTFVCRDTHLYGMLQAQRFGGKYIYFCPAGFNFIITPLLDASGPAAYAKVGPFLMVEKDDYIRYDLTDLLKLPADVLSDVDQKLSGIRFVPPEQVTRLSTLLYMTMGYVSNAQQNQAMRKTQSSEDIQGHIGELLQSLKAQNQIPSYPFKKENELMEAMIDGDKANANRLLNDLLGHIFFFSGGDFAVIRARVFELLVLLSRAAVEGGADATDIFSKNVAYFDEINHIKTLDDLCLWLVEIMNQLTDYVFRFTDVKHVDIIRKSVDYIRRNYASKLTLEEVASYVYLSPSYFSKVFKDEMELNFNAYLNKIRIEKAKQLLTDKRIKLIDVAGLVGFEDQSYFSKVFKKITGQTPGKFRETGKKK